MSFQNVRAVTHCAWSGRSSLRALSLAATAHTAVAHRPRPRLLGAGSRATSLSSVRAASSAADEYDVVVVGGGPAGYVTAIRAAQLGLKTACVEKRGTLGGTCLNVGCIPSKALLNISHKYHEAAHDFSKFGITFQGKPKIDVPKMMKHKETAMKGLMNGIEGLFKKHKIDYKKGMATLESDRVVSVELNPNPKAKGAPTETVKLRAKNVVLASGSEASPMPGGVVKVDEKTVFTSSGVLSLKQAPKKMLVVGGGVIGLELGSVWQRLGTEVQVVEYMNTIAPTLDVDMRALLQKALEKQGMKFHLSSKVTGATVRPGSAAVKFENSKGSQSFECDAVLLAVGRRPFTQGLGLEALAIEKDKMGRVVVDKFYRVPNHPNVYAIGDIIDGPMLAHKAEEEGVAVANFLGGHCERPHVNYNAIPSVVYTHPELAGVGKTEQELKEEKVNFEKATFPFMANSRARTNDDADGMVKILADPSTGKILGGWIFGPGAGELIHELVLAVEHGMTAQQVAAACHAHPTLSEAVMEACMNASPGGSAIHFS